MEAAMPNPLIEMLFLLAFWLPPAALLVGLLLLLLPWRHTSGTPQSKTANADRSHRSAA
jgi:hypothetical protein